MSKSKDTFTFEYDLKVSECPCGSGKKPEKCCGPVKTRTHSVDLDPRNYYESDGLAIGLDFNLKRIVRGELKPLIGKPKFSQSYKRKKNNKILVKGNSLSEYVMHPDSIILGYDDLFFVDTNTVDISGHMVSATGVIHAYYTTDKGQKALMYTPLTILEFWDSDVSPEILGWYAIVDAITNDSRYNGKKMAFIVDSQLGNLDKINSREIPLLGDYCLPNNITLVYASSDSASNMANKLMKACDRFSRDKLNELKINQKVPHFEETPYPCAGFRQWMH